MANLEKKLRDMKLKKQLSEREKKIKKKHKKEMAAMTEQFEALKKAQEMGQMQATFQRKLDKQEKKIQARTPMGVPWAVGHPYWGGRWYCNSCCCWRPGSGCPSHGYNSGYPG